MRTDDLAARARALISPDRRALLGITGPPGSGKSTLAERIHGAIGPESVLVPMDGFHLSKAELRAVGRLDRMGAPDTFDAAAFVDLIRTIRNDPQRTHAAPAFDRTVEAVVPGAIEVTPAHRLVIVEGNYLLLDTEPWSELRALLDAAWYVQIDDQERHRRLIRRHIAYGKAPEAAENWSLGSDESNAKLIAGSRGRADLVVQLSPS